ncbi:hypothetical protein [Microterricola viridarii]|uniref:hypothetical protein n=1 Tax=Microterricola viridarii TaxID=412690 RepID=UPI00101AE04B|nr:hypothetical protein [Microterricola viridarii]
MTEANDRPEPASDPVPGDTPQPAPGGTPAAAVTRGTLLWVGAGVVLLAFVASFLGSSMAKATAEPAPAPTVYVTQEPEAPADPAAIKAKITELMPTGSLVRVGVGAPSVDAGVDGDLYIDVSTSNVYLRSDGVWSFVGNLKEDVVENLAGEDGAQGATGAQGEAGAPGKPGEPGVAGTQVTLGTAAPEPTSACGVDGDIYLDTVAMAFYTCAAGAWVPQETQSTPAPKQTPASQ